MTREELNQEKQQEIVDEEKREKRKKIVILGLKITFFLIVFFFLFYFYTTYVSTGSFIIKEKRIVDSKLPQSFNGVKVIHFSDLHYGTTIFLEDLEKIVEEINVRNPDLVFFTGDLIDQNYKLTNKEQEKIIKKLQGINAKLGKYAVVGEEDGSSFTTIFNQSDFSILNNDYDLIYKNDNTPILLVGLTSQLKGNVDIDKGYKYFNEAVHDANIYTITMMHEPDLVLDVLNKYPTDLFLAGHSHNGMIRIPYLGSIKKLEGAKEYDQEFYQLDNDSKLYISSGLGTNGVGFRLFCKPSINFFRISQK